MLSLVPSSIPPEHEVYYDLPVADSILHLATTMQ